MESSQLWRSSRWVKWHHKLWVGVSSWNSYTSHCWRRSCSTWVTWCDSVSVQSTGQEVFYRGMWMPQAALVMHSILQLSWWTGLLKSIHCNQGHCPISRRGEWNRGHWQQPSWWWSWTRQSGWRCSWRPNLGLFGWVGIKIKHLKEMYFYRLSFESLSGRSTCHLDYSRCPLNTYPWSSGTVSILATTFGFFDALACKNSSRVGFYIPNNLRTLIAYRILHKQSFFQDGVWPPSLICL